MRRTPMATAALTLLALVTSPVALSAASADDQPGAADEKRAYACRQQNLKPGADRPPDGPVGRGHVAGLVETPAGDLLYSMDVGSRPFSRTFTTRLKPGQRVWSEPEQIPYDADPEETASLHNVVLFNDGEGRIHNFFTTIREGTSHGNSTLDYRFSDDDGHTWSDPEVLREQWGWMFGNRPFRMSNGEVIVPVYKENSPWGVGFLISDDNFETFEVHPPGDSLWPGSGLLVRGLQAATIELEPGHLLAFMRTSADYIYKTESFDYGRTWTQATPTQFPNPWSRVDLLKLDNGNLLLAYNPSSSDRTPLTLAMSEDGGQTWPYEVNVETTPESDFSYPFLWQASDRSLHMGYALRSNGAMGHLVFNEEFVRSGPDLASDPNDDLRWIEYRRGKLREVEECLYAWTRGIPFGSPDSRPRVDGRR